MQPEFLADEAATMALGARLAVRLQAPALILLEGDLGAGKTTLARALIRALIGPLAGDAPVEVPSPTFTLVQGYDSPRGPVEHFDLYRLRAPGEVYELGWDEALETAIVLVEWPERLGQLRPANAPTIRLEQRNDGRVASFENFTDD